MTRRHCWRNQSYSGV